MLLPRVLFTMRTALPLLLAALVSSQAQVILFQDTFARPNNRNIDAVLDGITNNTGSALPADAVDVYPWLDPLSRPPGYAAPDGNPADGGGSQIVSGVWQVKSGPGTANGYVNHNFVNASILSAGGYSCRPIAGTSQATSGQGAVIGLGVEQGAS